MLPTLRRTLPSIWDEPTEWFRRDLDLLKRDFMSAFSDWTPEFGEGLTAVYPVDIREDDEKVYVDAELPGFEKDQINVSLQNGMLTISAERKHEEKKGKKHLEERRYAKIERRLSMPTEVDEQKVKATFTNGVLHLELPNKPDAKERRIPVS